MNVSKILSDLRCEVQLLDEAIAGLEGVARNRDRRPGRLSKWLAKIESRPQKRPHLRHELLEVYRNPGRPLQAIRAMLQALLLPLLRNPQCGHFRRAAGDRPAAPADFGSAQDRAPRAPLSSLDRPIAATEQHPSHVAGARNRGRRSRQTPRLATPG